MILKGFKEKSNKKYLNKVLAERQGAVDDSEIESLGVIFNYDETENFEQFKKLADLIKALPNRVKIIAFSEREIGLQSAWDVCYNVKDLGWKGSINNSELKAFLKTEFDALISYYSKDVLELKLLTALSKAKFKIGVLEEDERLNDLIIKTKLNEFDVFKNELFKYLTILNKIKNE
ncbi:hypothetical protein RBH94_16005 [Aestuariibaculum sp. YM273]|uniref:DUF6913 domain-containing protein n=1 Tax=Aestuariibaculum sp. YM273 TaxID=3070659 RepID=UPI0027DC5573|nr:hypothetical protein [Aestuariibaculum sp. YM273]WMI65555.1 hypothetical protein RBH94_16005 [Aestuariibaculum sp. YM273]